MPSCFVILSKRSCPLLLRVCKYAEHAMACLFSFFSLIRKFGVWDSGLPLSIDTPLNLPRKNRSDLVPTKHILIMFFFFFSSKHYIHVDKNSNGDTCRQKFKWGNAEMISTSPQKRFLQKIKVRRPLTISEHFFY